MKKDDIIRMAREAGFERLGTYASFGEDWVAFTESLEAFANLVAAAERDALEAELLKLKKGIAANSEYIQGRWDLIGEFQDVIRARGTT